LERPKETVLVKVRELIKGVVVVKRPKPLEKEEIENKNNKNK